MAVTLRKPSDEEYAAWSVAEIQGYADAIAESGAMSREAAVEKARRDTAETLPEGLATPGHLIFRVDADGEPVGWVWLALQTPRAEAGVGFIYDISVDEAFRGLGYAQAAMHLLEDEGRRNGLHAIALNVFGNNATARALYSKLGYRETAILMRKEL